MTARVRAALALVGVVVGLLALPAGPATAGWNDGQRKCDPHHTCP